MSRATRIARILASPDRVAASPFPVTDDMMKYVEEGVKRLRSVISFIEDGRTDRRYQMIDNSQSELGQIIHKRVVHGSYGLDVVVHSYLKDKQGGQISGSYTPRKSNKDPHVISIQIPLFTGYLDYANYYLWEQIRKVLLHELIHVIHFEMTRWKGVHIPYHYYEPGGDEEAKEKYFLQNREMTAYEGSWRSDIERRMRAGFSKKDTLQWVIEKLKGDSQQSGYEKFVSKYPERVNDYISRLTKIVNKVYHREPDLKDMDRVLEMVEEFQAVGSDREQVVQFILPRLKTPQERLEVKRKINEVYGVD